MDGPSVPGLIFLYVFLGLVFAVATMHLWKIRRAIPSTVFVFFFPVYTMSGRGHRRMPVIDYLAEYWKSDARRPKRLTVLALYLLASVLIWPGRLVWPAAFAAVIAVGLLALVLIGLLTAIFLAVVA